MRDGGRGKGPSVGGSCRPEGTAVCRPMDAQGAYTRQPIAVHRHQRLAAPLYGALKWRNHRKPWRGRPGHRNSGCSCETECPRG